MLFNLCIPVLVSGIFLMKVSSMVLSNIAVNKNTKQSTTYLYYNKMLESYLANDGKTQTDCTRLGCAHTEFGQNSWWAVNLGNVFDIKKIIIYGRTDAATERFKDFDVDAIAPQSSSHHLTIDTMECGQITFSYYVQHTTTKLNISCPDTTSGQFVRIRQRGKEFLTSCEVEVYGELSDPELPAPWMSQYKGFHERKYQGTIIETEVASSVVHCALYCHLDSCCFAANFNNKTGQCVLAKQMDSTTYSGLKTAMDWNAFLRF